MDLGLWTFQPLTAPLEGLADDLADLFNLINAHEGIHFRQQFGQLLPKPLRQAAGHHQALSAIVRVAKFSRLENSIDAFFLRGIDERAGIDDHHVGLGRIVDDLRPALEQRAEHNFGVHQVLGAAEGNQPDAQGVFWLMTFHSKDRTKYAMASAQRKGKEGAIGAIRGNQGNGSIWSAISALTAIFRRGRVDTNSHECQRQTKGQTNWGRRIYFPLCVLCVLCG